jgi:hypothetical protein
MPLNLCRPHGLECEAGHPEESFRGIRGIIFASGTLNGQFRRKYTGKLDSGRWSALWGASGSWDGEQKPHEPPPPPPDTAAGRSNNTPHPTTGRNMDSSCESPALFPTAGVTLCSARNTLAVVGKSTNRSQKYKRREGILRVLLIE